MARPKHDVDRVFEELGTEPAPRRTKEDTMIEATAEIAVFPAAIRPTPWAVKNPKDTKPREWIYGEHFIRNYLSAGFGAPGSGKSSKRLVESVAMATNRNLLGVTPDERCRVWYWNGEDPQEETERRVIAICMHYGIPQDELVGWLFTDSGRTTPIILAEQTKTGTRIYEPIADALVAAMKTNQMDALIVDPFVSCHHVTENDNGAIDIVAKRFASIAEKTNAAVGIEHHIRKTNGREATVDDGRGASSLVGAARAIEVINKMTKEEGARLGVDQHWRYFCVDDGKGNMSPPHDREWFQFASVKLGNGTKLYPDGDNVGVVASWTPPKALDDVTAIDFDCAAMEIRKGRWRKSSQSQQWVGIPVAKALGLNLTDEKQKKRVSRVIGAWSRPGVSRSVRNWTNTARRGSSFGWPRMSNFAPAPLWAPIVSGAGGAVAQTGKPDLNSRKSGALSVVRYSQPNGLADTQTDAVKRPLRHLAPGCARLRHLRCAKWRTSRT